MKIASIILVLIVFVGQVVAADKKEDQVISKSIQCSYLREKSFADIFELYSIEKQNSEYIRKVSDSIYSQAFKICDPDNISNADKDILSVCTTGCIQLVTKGLLGIGGPSTSDIEKCKKMCLNYSDLLSVTYTASTKALKKLADSNPPTPKRIEPTDTPAAPAPSQITSSLPTDATILENKEDHKEK